MTLDPRTIPEMTPARFYRIWFWISLVYGVASAFALFAFANGTSAKRGSIYDTLFCLIALCLFVAAAIGSRRHRPWTVFVVFLAGLADFAALSVVRGRISDSWALTAWTVALLILLIVAALGEQKRGAPSDKPIAHEPLLFRWPLFKKFHTSEHWRRTPRGILVLQLFMITAVLLGLRDWITFAISGLMHDGPVFRLPTTPEFWGYIKNVLKEAGYTFLFTGTLWFFARGSRETKPMSFIADWTSAAILFGLAYIIAALVSPIFQSI